MHVMDGWLTEGKGDYTPCIMVAHWRLMFLCIHHDLSGLICNYLVAQGLGWCDLQRVTYANENMHSFEMMHQSVSFKKCDVWHLPNTSRKCKWWDGKCPFLQGVSGTDAKYLLLVLEQTRCSRTLLLFFGLTDQFLVSRILQNFPNIIQLLFWLNSRVTWTKIQNIKETRAEY